MERTCGYSGCGRGFLPYEDHWNVDGVPCHVTKAPGQNDDKVTCYWAYKHERTAARFPWPNAVFRLHWVSALLILVFAATLHADEPGDVRGCYVAYIGTSGKFIYEPFLKVADKEAPAEDGESEVWGFRPWNLEPPDKEGKTHPVNIRAGRFVPLNTFAEVDAGTGKRRIKCPDGLW